MNPEDIEKTIKEIKEGYGGTHRKGYPVVYAYYLENGQRQSKRISKVIDKGRKYTTIEILEDELRDIITNHNKVVVGLVKDWGFGFVPHYLTYIENGKIVKEEEVPNSWREYFRKISEFLGYQPDTQGKKVLVAVVEGDRWLSEQRETPNLFINIRKGKMYNSFERNGEILYKIKTGEDNYAYIYDENYEGEPDLYIVFEYPFKPLFLDNVEDFKRILTAFAKEQEALIKGNKQLASEIRGSIYAGYLPESHSPKIKETVHLYLQHDNLADKSIDEIRKFAREKLKELVPKPDENLLREAYWWSTVFCTSERCIFHRDKHLFRDELGAVLRENKKIKSSDLVKIAEEVKEAIVNWASGHCPKEVNFYKDVVEKTIDMEKSKLDEKLKEMAKIVNENKDKYVKFYNYRNVLKALTQQNRSVELMKDTKFTNYFEIIPD